jgi:hypothetical protein
MSADAFIIVILSIVAAAGGVLVLVRSIARANLNRAIARFERDLAFPLWPNAPHEASADERALGRED